MVKRKTLNKWKPVNLEGPIVSGDLAGLVGIEELTDYDINTIVTKPSKRKPTGKDDEETKRKKIKRDDPNLPSKKRLRKKKSKSTEELTKVTEVNGWKVETVCSMQIDTPKVKKKVEIGQLSNDVEKCSDEDLAVWSSYALPEPLLRGIADLGFKRPTMIQELVLPAAILGRRDILGAAETGSGKTLAFGLPILTGILKLKEENVNMDSKEVDVDDSEESDFEREKNGIGCVKVIRNIKMKKNTSRKTLKPLYALILTPTRELAIQIKNHLTAVTKYTDIRVAVILGGMAAVKQERILNKGPEIVVATPGRLWELIKEGNSHLSQVENIRYLAIDETDRMIEKGHFQELQELLERLNWNKNKQELRQNFVFSATLTLVHDLPNYLSSKKKLGKSSKINKLTPTQKLQQITEWVGITNPKVVDITQKTGVASTLTECRINCEFFEKDYYVYYFLQKHPGRTLIFCNSITSVKRLAGLLALLGCCSLPLHACMPQRQRLKNLERFRDNELGVLVATDVAARGLDIPKVEHVLHYQTPRTSESYIHRSGRTARAFHEGLTLLLIEPNEVKTYLKLCRTLGKSHDLPSFPVQLNMLLSVKTRVNLARDLEKLNLQLKRYKSETSWLQKAADDLDIIIDETEFPQGKKDKGDMANLKRLLTQKRRELNELLEKPIFPRGFSIKYPTLNNGLFTSDNTTRKAIDVLKDELNHSKSNNKKKNIKLFRGPKRFKKKNKNVNQN